VSGGIKTGSALLNLALSGGVEYGWPLGRVSNVVGDKSSGKTLLAIEAMTNILLNCPDGFDNSEAYYFETEAAFNSAYADVIGCPVDRIKFLGGETIEEFFNVVDGICRGCGGDKTARLFVLDSLDALSSKEEVGNDISAGTYGMAKQKKLGEMFRRLAKQMEGANLHLMIISQVRDVINAMPFAKKQRRSGGRALDFYSTHIVWLVERSKLKSTKTDWAYGIMCEMEVTKNKIAMPFRKIKVPIIFNYGLDDLGSQIDFLIDRKSDFLNRRGAYYRVEGDAKGMLLKDFVERFEDDSELRGRLVEQCALVWADLESLTAPNRRTKYGLQ